jgi:hypothetical protein
MRGMRMSHRNVGSEGLKNKKDSDEVVELKKSIKPLRDEFKKVAPTNKAFQRALELVTKEQIQGGVLVVYTLLNQFDHYTSVNEINRDFDRLCNGLKGSPSKWQQECKEKKISDGLIEGGRLLLETYRCHFIQAFYDKRRLTLSPSNSPSGALEGKELPVDFIASAKPVIDELKTERITTMPLSQWLEQPFDSLKDFKVGLELPMDTSLLLNELKDLSNAIELHRSAVTKANQEIKVDLSSIELVKQEETRIEMLLKQKKHLAEQEEHLSFRRKNLSDQIDRLRALYLSNLKLQEDKHRVAYDQLQIQKANFDHPFKQSREAKQLDQQLEQIRQKQEHKKNYFDAKTENIADLTPRIENMRQQALDFNITFNGKTAGNDISSIYSEITKSINNLKNKLGEPEDLVTQQQIDLSSIEAAFKKNKEAFQKEKERLYQDANQELIQQTKKEALSIRKKRYEEHVKMVEEILTVPPVEIRGVLQLGEALDCSIINLRIAREKEIDNAFEQYKEEFKKIQALSPVNLEKTASAQEIKINPGGLKEKVEAELRDCVAKREKLEVFIKSVIDWCETWGGVSQVADDNPHKIRSKLIKLSKLPQNMHDFHEKVLNYLLKLDDHFDHLTKAALKVSIQLKVAEFEAVLEEIRRECKGDSANSYAVEVIRLRGLQKQILLYKENKIQEDKAVVTQSEALDLLDESFVKAMKNAVDNHGRIWGAKIAEKFEPYEAKMNAKVQGVLSSKQLDNIEKKEALLKITEDIENERKRVVAAAEQEIQDPELEQKPKKEIDSLYGDRLKVVVARKAFELVEVKNQVPLQSIVRQEPIEPKWSTLKFIFSLSLWYWCSYRSQKVQYDREIIAWSASSAAIQGGSDASRNNIGGGSTSAMGSVAPRRVIHFSATGSVEDSKDQDLRQPLLAANSPASDILNDDRVASSRSSSIYAASQVERVASVPTVSQSGAISSQRLGVH